MKRLNKSDKKNNDTGRLPYSMEETTVKTGEEGALLRHDCNESILKRLLQSWTMLDECSVEM